MLVRNTTGVPQIAPNHSLLPPNIPLRVPEEVNWADALWMYTHKMATLDGVVDSDKLLWKTEQGTHLYWLSPFSKGDGYAVAAENMVHALIDNGAILEVHQCWFMERDGLRPKTIQLLDAEPTIPHRVGLCMATPGEFRKLPTPYRIGLTMYEADNPLANMPEWAHDCEEVDMLVVPSDYCKDIFEEFVTKPVHVCPLPINPAFLTAKRRIPSDTFTFVSYGTLTGRKAPLETLAAFQKGFPKDKYPDVRFEFKTRLGYFGWSENMLPDLDDSRVKIINDNWYTQQMIDWLHSADAMVFASKGEGFGMPPREAIATGLPTILSNNTGLIPMCDARYTWPVPTQKMESSPLGGDWRIPNWDYLIDAMRWVYDHREKAYVQGENAAKWFAKEHGQDTVAKRLLNIIDSVDPATSSVRHNRPQLAKSEVYKDHADFINWFIQQVPLPGPVWDMGVGEGLLYEILYNLGYDIHGVVTKTEAEVAGQALRDRGINPQLIITEHGVVHTERLQRDGIKMPAACVSMGVLQKLSAREINTRLEAQIRLAPKVFFSVPSVFYPGYYGEDSHMMRQAQWADILTDLAFNITPYGKGDRYFRGEVREAIIAPGIVQRKNGRILQGVWHENR